MKFKQNQFYHVFNRGNNKQAIFPLERNYQFFLEKLRKEIADICDIVAYCLMPNHFHLLLHYDEASIGLQLTNQPNLQLVEQKIGKLQSSYTRAINNQENRTGSLFQIKFHCLELSPHHAVTCFHYIHQNPLKANLVNQFKDWKFSSFNEYLNEGDYSLCKKEIAYLYFDIPNDNEKFKKLSNSVVINDFILSKLD